MKSCLCPEEKLHLRHNPTTGHSLMLCYAHAKRHDEGHGFPVYQEVALMTEYIEQLIAKAESDVKEYEARAAVHGDGPDAGAVHDRIIFHQGQVSGLRHALFALRHGEGAL